MAVPAYSGNGMPSRIMSVPARENPTIAMVTDSIKASVEQDYLDVPAFIRKRGEINLISRCSADLKGHSFSRALK